jgi:indole-3-glycerol phosphate synthase
MTILTDIEAYKRREIEQARAAVPLAVLERRARDAPRARGFLHRLREMRAKHELALIGEIKKASPSKGLIRDDFNPVELARAYERGGAACLSVLTDAPSFQGAPEYLEKARAATGLPVLRKDFLFDLYQVVEARALGADCILIIMACVDDTTARGLLEAAKTWAMDALIEVHDERELDRALALDPELIGINNRDLNTFATNLSVTFRLAPRVPSGKQIIAESGIERFDDLKRLADIGVTSFLVGESLMRQRDVEAATRGLLGRA